MGSRYFEIQLRRFKELSRHNAEAAFNVLRNPFYREKRPLNACGEEAVKNRFPAFGYSLANSYYGIGKMLEDAAHYRGNLPGFIEHGLHLGGENPVTANSVLPFVVTLGPKRRRVIRRTVSDKPILTVGPYIHYAPSLLDEGSFAEIKNKIGKMLLVFPAHGVEGVDVEYDSAGFIDEVRSFVRHQSIDTVFVCLYFKDLPLFRSVYEKAGYYVVCSGHRSDPSFLSRQRSFIELSDYTMSNSVGTHIGYCCSLQKPHIVVDQHAEYRCESLRDEKAIPNHKTREFELDTGKIKDAFSDLSLYGSIGQQEILTDYWGFGEEKSGEQLQRFFEASRYVLRKSSVCSMSYADLYLRYADQSDDPILKSLIRDSLE